MKIVFVLLCSLASSTFSVAKSAESSVVNLSSKTIQKAVDKDGGQIFIRFYASWCPDCRAFTPHWYKVGHALSNLVTVADFDCAKYSKICNAFNIQQYPTFIWLNNGEIVDNFEGERSAKQLISYGKKLARRRPKRGAKELKEFQSYIREITSKEFLSTIAENTTLVTFCVPWCVHCRHNLVKLADVEKRFVDEPEIKIVKIDCNKDVNSDLCIRYLHSGVPTNTLFVNGVKIVNDYHRDSIEEFEDMMRSNSKGPAERSAWKKQEKERKKIRKAKEAAAHKHKR